MRPEASSDRGTHVQRPGSDEHSWEKTVENNSDEQLTILYLDDSPALLKSVSEVLRVGGHTVRTATDVEAALQSVHDVDLVMVDYHLPGEQCEDVLRRLKQAATGGEREVVFYLYTVDRDIAVTYKAIGFDGAFVSKGEADLLPDQLVNAARMLRLRRFRRRTATG